VASSAAIRACTAVTCAPRSAQAVARPRAGVPSAPRGGRGGPLPGLEDRRQLRPEALGERFPHRGQGRAERGAPPRLATRQLGAGAAETPDQMPELGQGPRGLTVEQDLPLLQEVGAVHRVLRSCLSTSRPGSAGSSRPRCWRGGGHPPPGLRGTWRRLGDRSRSAPTRRRLPGTRSPAGPAGFGPRVG